MRRLCGRPGCSAPATVTFTFDASRRIVWLNTLSDGTARAGDLCTRHADALVPPQGWTRDDRREVVPTTIVTADPTPVAVDELLPHREPKRRKRKTQRWSDVPSLFDPPTEPTAERDPAVVLELVETSETVDAEVTVVETIDIDERPRDEEPSIPAWEPRFDVDDLDGLLDAKSPLLSRAFRAAKAPDDTGVDVGEPVDPDEVF